MTSELDSKGVSDAVGAALRLIRKQRGLTVEELGEKCAASGFDDVTANAIYSIENGRRKGGERTRRVTVDELFVLAKVLEVSPFELAGQPVSLPAWLEKLIFDLALTVATSGEPDDSESVGRALVSGVLTPEHNDTVERVNRARRPARQANRAAMKASFDNAAEPS